MHMYVHMTLRSLSRLVGVKYAYVLSHRCTSLSIRWIFNARLSKSSAYNKMLTARNFKAE